MATIKYEMTPQERSNALAEAKARGVPAGWTVELDVSDPSLYCIALHCVFFVY